MPRTAKPFLEDDDSKKWSMRRRVFGRDLYVSGYKSAAAAEKAMAKMVKPLQERGAPKGLGPSKTTVAQALQDSARERLRFQKGARQEANRINRYLRAGRLETVRLSRDLFQELSLELRHLCRPLGQVTLKGIARGVELMALLWRDPVRFPSHVVIRESGERIALPTQDTVCFGRGEQVDRTTANDVALGLPDALAARQVSRRHFELRAHPEGYLLKALTSQSTEVDGVTMQRERELPIRPGSSVKLADVMTLDFVSPSLADEGTVGATLGRPRVISIN